MLKTPEPLMKYTAFFMTFLLMSQGIYAKTPYPQDVQKITSRADTCFHFMGEFSGDPQKDGPRKLNQKINFYCKNIDKDLQKLHRKYQSNKAIQEKLAEYDDLLSI